MVIGEVSMPAATAGSIGRTSAVDLRVQGTNIGIEGRIRRRAAFVRAGIQGNASATARIGTDRMPSFEDEVETEIPALLRYARSLTRDEDRARDLLQDALERALSRRHLWRATGKLRWWLFAIMHNLHVNAVRAAIRRPRSVVLEPQDEPRVAPVQAMRAEIAEAFAAFDLLSPEHRELLLLVVEGLSYREAAKVLDIKEGTVMSRMSRARERLAELMQSQAHLRFRRVK
jgi:RNA polymerase sigma-70 factor (ECF subfamily)